MMENNINEQLQKSLEIITAVAAENNRTVDRIINNIEQQENKLYKKWNVLGLIYNRRKGFKL